MPNTTQYINQLQRMDRIIKSKTEGLTHADSMVQLPFPGNCMNWNLGHLMVYRIEYLGKIDGSDSKPHADELALYGAGSEPLTDSKKAIQFETLRTRLDELSEQMIIELPKLSSEKLAKIINAERGMTLEDGLQFYMMFHESYHVGQLELLYELALDARQ